MPFCTKAVCLFVFLSGSKRRENLQLYWFGLLFEDWEIGQVTYPNMMEFFESLGVDMETSDMTFSVSLDKGHGCEWGSRNGLSSLFAQKKNVLNPYFWQMLREILKFKDDVLRQGILFPTLDMTFFS